MAKKNKKTIGMAQAMMEFSKPIMELICRRRLDKQPEEDCAC